MNNPEITEQMYEIIRKALPEHEVKAIANMAKEVEGLRKENKAVNARGAHLEEVSKKTAEVNTKLMDEAIKVEDQRNLNSLKRQDLDLYERNLQLREAVLDLKEQHSCEKVELVKNCFSQVFRNTIIRETVNRTSSQDTVMSGGEMSSGYVDINGRHQMQKEPDFTMPTSKTDSETTTIEED